MTYCKKHQKERKQTISEAIKSFKLNGFQGIDRLRWHTAPECSADIVNFRISADGSLEKRCGYKKICAFEKGVRAIWTGKHGEHYACYVLSENKIFSVNTESGETSEVGELQSTDTEAELFLYRGTLYVIDGVQLYALTENGTVKPFGYVPLVGKDWQSSERGAINEPRNMLNDKGRMSYIAVEGRSVLYLDSGVLSVDAIYVNGTEVSRDKYTVSANRSFVTLSGTSAGDRVMLYFTYAENSNAVSELMKNTRAAVFGGINTSRPFLFGGSNSAAVYSSAYVSDTSLAEAKFMYPQSDALYFPFGCEFAVGDGNCSVSTVGRHYDRLLIFTDNGTWRADSEACGTEEFPVMNVNSSVGVLSRNGAAVLEDSPYTVGTDGIYRWTADTDELNDCNAIRISDEIGSLLGRDFYRGACIFADTERRELLVSCPEASERTWVYSAAAEAWTCFSGIGAEKFFRLDSGIGFLRGGAIYAFDSALYTDEGRPISACFRSAVLDFGTDRRKRMTELGVSAEGGRIEVGIYADGKRYSSASTVFYAEEGHALLHRRLHGGGFRYITLSLSASAEARQTIHSLYVTARVR